MPRAPHSSALLAGRPVGEAPRVLDQRVARCIDALEQGQGQACDLGHREQAALGRLPDKGVARRRGGVRHGAGRQTLQSRRDALQNGVVRGVRFAFLAFAIPNPLFFHGCKGGPHGYSPRPKCRATRRGRQRSSGPVCKIF